MEQTSVQKLARVLRVLVVVTFVCNIIALFFVPYLARRLYTGYGDLDCIVETFRYDVDDGLAIFFDSAYYDVWERMDTAVLTMFLWFCGICTAVILWQGKRVLDTILKGNPFTLGNAVSLKRAAVCCFVIASAALLRLIWGFVTYRNILPLLTYNALFVPIFLMAGLVCMVMSALFRQAAELKAENDLTI